MADANQTRPISCCFERVVGVRIDGHWHFIEGPEQSFQCLTKAFIEYDRPSHVRALETYEAFRAKRVAARSVQAAFIVAAMASGYPFEMLQRDEVLMERRVSAAVEDAVYAALM